MTIGVNKFHLFGQANFSWTSELKPNNQVEYYVYK